MHPIDISNCDIYEDLEINTSKNNRSCIQAIVITACASLISADCTGDGCARDYRLYDADYVRME